MFNWWEISGLLHEKATMNMEMWCNMVQSGLKKELQITFLFNVVWSLWFYRNEIKFGGKNEYFQGLIETIKIRLGHQLKYYVPNFPYSPWMVANNLDTVTTQKKQNQRCEQ